MSPSVTRKDADRKCITEHIFFSSRFGPAKRTGTNFGVTTSALALVNGHMLETEGNQGHVKRAQPKGPNLVTFAGKKTVLEWGQG